MRVVLASSSLLLALAIVGSAQPDPKAKPAFKLSADEQRLLDLTNAERKKENLPLLAPHPLLFKAALAHSKNMAKHEKLEHDLDCKTPFDRIDDVKYHFQRAGENIARSDGETSMEEILKLWMDSEGHRANILKATFTEIGIGLFKNEKGELYYTQVFAAPFKQ